MPREVVPIFPPPLAASRAWSSAAWHGSRTGARFDTKSRPSPLTPASRSRPSSARKASGEITMPLPITQLMPSCRMPDGMSCSEKCRSRNLTVCPALCPPW